MKERIQIMMKNENLTSSKLAEILKIQPSNISHLLSGRNKPSYELLQKIKEAFPHISGDWLISGVGSYSIINHKSEKIEIGPNIKGNQVEIDFESEKAQKTVKNEDLPLNSEPVIQPKAESLQSLPLNQIKRVLLIYDDMTFDVVNSR